MNTKYKVMMYGRELVAVSALLISHQAYSACGPGEVGGQVFLELPVSNGAAANTYGVMDPNESGLSGIAVTVLDASGVSQAVATDSNGEWAVTTSLTYPVRVQFNWSQSWLQNSFEGTDSNTSIQFASSPECSVNLGLHDPSDYSQQDPAFALACYINGSGVGSSEPGLVSTPYSSTGLNLAYQNSLGVTGSGPMPSVDANVNELGSVWGSAWQAGRQRLFLSTFLKRHTGMAGNPGDVYVMDYSGVSPTLAGTFNLTGVVPANGGSPIALGSVCRSAACANDTGNTGLAEDYVLSDVKTTANRDLDAFAKVGAISFGDADMQPGRDTLWLVNTFQNALISVDVSGNTAALPGAVNQYPLGAVATCSGGIMRPWGLAFFRGRGYLGAVCDASLSEDRNDLQAYVVSFDPDNMASGFTTEINFPLNYTRSTNSKDDFQYWLDQYTVPPVQFQDLPNRVLYPQPILSDIAFDANGNMYLNLMDRMSHQIGYQNYEPVSGSTDLLRIWATGDMLKACATATGFVLEGSATCPVNFNNSVGPFGQGEFFEDIAGDTHSESANGSFLQLPGTNEIVSLALDPHPSGTTGAAYFATHGVNTYDLSTGLIANWYSVNYADDVGLFGKGNGLGDLALLTDPAPVEIGNRVWKDSNRNGLQDPGEPGIDGVIVVLSCGTDTVSAITENGGHYYFSNANTVPAGVTQAPFMDFGESCTLSIDTGLSILAELSVSDSNQDNNATNNALTDLLDSDAILNSSQAEISFTVGQPGENNHGLDFAFKDTCSLNTPTITSLCLNNGTPSDSSDDLFNYTINTNGSHTATTYLISGDDAQAGIDYEVDHTFGNFAIADGDLSLVLTDNDEASCQLSPVTVPAPDTCSNVIPVCVINTPTVSAECNDNGTPTDASDDLFNYNIQTTGTNHSGTYNITGSHTQNGVPYDQAFTFGSFSIANGGLDLTVIDATDATCQQNVAIAAPATCSNVTPTCSINAPGVATQCNNNNTPADPSDDVFSYTIVASGQNTSGTYAISGSDSQTGVAYGQIGSFGLFPIRDGDLTLALTDSVQSSCQFTNVSVPAPATCSNVVPVCSINSPSITTQCHNNNTPADPSDDVFRYTIHASGSNTSATYAITGGDSRSGVTYGASTTFGDFPISAGNLTVSLVDSVSSSCQLSNITVVPPDTCSTPTTPPAPTPPPTTTPESIPTLSEWMLALLSMATVFLGLRSRQKARAASS